MSDVDGVSVESSYLDREYNPRIQIPEFATYFSRWKARAREARTLLQGNLHVRYGTTAAETLDFFPSSGSSRPLFLFVHGGYWRALDKEDFSWIAPKYVEAGIAVAVINYGLAPATPVAEIVRQLRRACIWLYRNASALGIDADRIFCSGHSAGGHLAAMMLATDWPSLLSGLPRRLLAGALTISGLFDLEPLRHTQFLGQDLGLDAQQARELSPAFLSWCNDVPLIRAVGELESDEFHRQSVLMERQWPRACSQPLIDVSGSNHLSVCDALADTDSPLFQAVQAALMS